MNNKQKRTLQKILQKPVRNDIHIDEVKALISGMNGVWTEKSKRGSRLMISINGRKFSLHKPHPDPTLKPYAIKDLAQFLTEDVGDYLKEQGILP